MSTIIMIDIFDLIHYFIGFVILGIFLWTIIKLHNFFTRNNKVIPNNSSTKWSPLSMSPKLI